MESCWEQIALLSAAHAQRNPGPGCREARPVVPNGLYSQGSVIRIAALVWRVPWHTGSLAALRFDDACRHPSRGAFRPAGEHHDTLCGLAPLTMQQQQQQQQQHPNVDLKCLY